MVNLGVKYWGSWEWMDEKCNKRNVFGGEKSQEPSNEMNYKNQISKDHPERAEFRWLD